MSTLRPNILLIVTDQQRFDTIAALGNPGIRTPVLDGLVRSGVSFTRAYTPSPVCAAARYAMHTGLMPHENGLFDNGPALPAAGESVAQILSRGGYQTFAAGKMHWVFPNGRTAGWGYDERAISDGMTQPGNHYMELLEREGYGYVASPLGVRSEMYYVPQTSQLPARLNHTTWVTDRCIDYIQRRDPKRPFFVQAAFEKPHPPFEPPVPWNRLYRSAAMTDPNVPANHEECWTFWNRFQNRYKYRDSGTDRHLLRTMKAHYYAEISFLDQQLGRLIRELEDAGARDNTVILFTTDHGELMGDYHCFGKRCFLDAAARIPLIACWPGGPAGVTCERPVSLIDLLPTCLSTAGITPGREYPGRDLFAIAEGRDTSRPSIFGQFQTGRYANYMTLDDRYKYIYSVPDRREYFFDLVRDPRETENRAGSSLYHAAIAGARSRALAYFSAAPGAVEDGQWKAYAQPDFHDTAAGGLLFQDEPQSLPHIEGYSDELSTLALERFVWPGN